MSNETPKIDVAVERLQLPVVVEMVKANAAAVPTTTTAIITRKGRMLQFVTTFMMEMRILTSNVELYSKEVGPVFVVWMKGSTD